jgi:hypothetical protein
VKSLKKVFVKLGLAAFFLATGSSAFAETIYLTAWNVSDIQGTGDFVQVIIGTDSTESRTTITFQWREADTTDDLTKATALDQVYFNIVEENWQIIDVLDNGVSDFDAWSFAVGGETSGAGGLFGMFASRAAKESPADDGGIYPNSFTFLFSGLVTFTSNDAGAKFSAHVRYGDSQCSGWVADLDAIDPSSQEPGSCSTPVPEPGTLSLLGFGLLGIAIFRRRYFLRG